MATKRAVSTEIFGFKGVMIYQWQVATLVDTIDADPQYFSLDNGSLFQQYKCGIIFINVTAIGGTWQFRLFTSLRLSSTSPHRHLMLNTVQVVGRTTTGKFEVGWNAYSGANTLLADKVELEVDNTAGAPTTVTYSADVAFYN